jgi:hypothetical protein
VKARRSRRSLWSAPSQVRRIDVVPKQIIWSEDGTLCVIASDTSFYILKCALPSASISRYSGVPRRTPAVDLVLQVRV